MLPSTKDYRRVKRRIDTALERQIETADEPIETILDAAADLLGITGSCWHHTDPGSGLPIASAMLASCSPRRSRVTTLSITFPTG